MWDFFSTLVKCISFLEVNFSHENALFTAVLFVCTVPT
jgi:hypothetical protein